jgi:hypothetical protein
VRVVSVVGRGRGGERRGQLQGRQEWRWPWVLWITVRSKKIVGAGRNTQSSSGLGQLLAGKVGGGTRGYFGRNRSQCPPYITSACIE